MKKGRKPNGEAVDCGSTISGFNPHLSSHKHIWKLISCDVGSDDGYDSYVYQCDKCKQIKLKRIKQREKRKNKKD